MSSVISLSRLRAETELCHRFHLTYNSPLSPINFSACFDQIAFCISASTYIALKNSVAQFSISHIKNIKKHYENAEERCFLITCNDYSVLDNPMPVEILLKCS